MKMLMWETMRLLNFLLTNLYSTTKARAEILVMAYDRSYWLGMHKVTWGDH